MSGERVERRLAAILAADVAGYSRLMGEDEEGTLAALKAIRRELGAPKIAEHRCPRKCRPLPAGKATCWPNPRIDDDVAEIDAHAELDAPRGR